MTEPVATPDLEPLPRLLGSSLEAASDEAVRDRWDAYLRGAARFRGVPMAGIRGAVRATLRQGLAELDRDTADDRRSSCSAPNHASAGGRAPAGDAGGAAVRPDGPDQRGGRQAL